MAFLDTIWALVPGADDTAKLRFAIVAAGGVGVVWGLIRWLRKEDLGTTAKTILKTQRSAEERAAGDSERLRHLEGLVQNLEATLTSRLAALPGAKMNGGAATAIAQDFSAAVRRLAADGKDEALAALADGDERGAMTALWKKRDEKGKAREAASKDEAALTRQLGALALLGDAQGAMRHYAEACELDPGNAMGWIQLGHLQRSLGDTVPAMKSYERALALGEQTGGMEGMAAATADLGRLHEMQGEMEAACEKWRAALKLFRQIGMQSQVAQVEGWMRAAGCPD